MVAVETRGCLPVDGPSTPTDVVRHSTRVRQGRDTEGEATTMAQVRFNHMELTVPRGTLDADMRADLTAFYGDVLGWQTSDVEIVGGMQFLMRPDDGQFILVAEHDRPLQAPGYDHLGLLCETRDEVDEILEACRRWQEKDDRMRLKVYDDLEMSTVVVHAFYVKYLLPIWFDVQSMEHAPGAGPTHRWKYGPVTI